MNHHIAAFAMAVAAAKSAKSEGEAWDLLYLAYCESKDIRNMSPDEHWKVPCNEFATAFMHRETIGISGLLLEADKMLRDLPSDAHMVQLDYEQPRPTALS